MQTETPLLVTLDPTVVFYGPHECARGCGQVIVKAERERGGAEFDVPAGPVYPNTRWTLHNCPKREFGAPLV